MVMAASYSSRLMLTAGAGSPDRAMQSGSRIDGGSGMYDGPGDPHDQREAVDQDGQRALLDVGEDLVEVDVGDGEDQCRRVEHRPDGGDPRLLGVGLGKVGEDRERGVGLLEVEHPVGRVPPEVRDVEAADPLQAPQELRCAGG